MKSRAISNELTSELYESLINVHPCCPSFTSKRMATGSNCAIRASRSSGLTPRQSATAAQAKEHSIEASSINGRW